jgi:hypothetical protein
MSPHKKFNPKFRFLPHFVSSKCYLYDENPGKLH